MNAAVAQDQPEKEKKGVNELLAKLRANPRVPIIIASAAMIAVVIALVLWAKQPDFRVLFSNVSSEDGSAIVTQLTQMNVAWQFDEHSGKISVPADQVAGLRMRLAQQGLPKGSGVGFELLDKEKFGISQFSEQVNYQRALEGELARTIETLGPVKSARVHLAIPKPTLFVREQKSPSASVTLALQAGRVLDEGQISAIVHMVSSSVAGMPAGNVTVVDQRGHLLTKAAASDHDLNDMQLKYTADVEARYQQRIESILSPLTGDGNVHAQVTAQLNFSVSEQTSEQYKPNNRPADQAIRSLQSSDNLQTGRQYPGGVPGALSNQPAPANTAPITTQGQRGTNSNNLTNDASIVPSDSSKERTINYEVDRTIRHTRLNVGDVQRLAVAVVVNYRHDASGKPVALSDAQLKQIENLSREAMGFNPGRGDTLNIVNAPFSQNNGTSDATPFWQQPGFTELLLGAGRWALVVLVAWLLYRKLLRPLLMRQQAGQAQTDEATTRQSAAMAAEDDISVTLSNEAEKEYDSRYRTSAGKSSQRVREIAGSDPRMVARVMRNWMKDE